MLRHLGLFHHHPSPARGVGAPLDTCSFPRLVALATTVRFRRRYRRHSCGIAIRLAPDARLAVASRALSYYRMDRTQNLLNVDATTRIIDLKMIY